MKIYGSSVFSNERADLTGKSYINLCLKNIQEGLEWLEKDDSCQTLPADLKVLLILAHQFPEDVFFKLNINDLKSWEIKYNEWYKKNQKKIPAKYRYDLKKNVDEVFLSLQDFANDISWL